MTEDEIRDMETAMREFDAFERMYRKSEPVAGGADLERKNQYWIELGAKRAEERIIKLLEEMPWQIYSGVALDGKPIESVLTPKVLIREDAIALIKGENK